MVKITLTSRLILRKYLVYMVKMTLTLIVFSKESIQSCMIVFSRFQIQYIPYIEFEIKFVHLPFEIRVGCEFVEMMAIRGA